MRHGREMPLDLQISAGSGPAPAPISSHFLDDLLPHIRPEGSPTRISVRPICHGIEKCSTGPNDDRAGGRFPIPKSMI